MPIYDLFDEKYRDDIEYSLRAITTISKAYYVLSKVMTKIDRKHKVFTTAWQIII